MPLVPASLQLKNSNQIQTTELRIKALGCGLIGVCREKYEKTPLPQPRRPPCAHSRSLPARHSFLTQAHNKREYAHVSGSAVKFDALSFHVNQRMTKHLSDIVSPRLAAILGKVPSRPQPAPSAPLLPPPRKPQKPPPKPPPPKPPPRLQTAARELSEERAAPVSAAAGQLAPAGAVEGGPHRPAQASRPRALPASRISRMCGQRMRATDGTEGRVVQAADPHRCRLQLSDYRLSTRSYRPEDLRATAFDPQDIILNGAPADLHGEVVRVWWQDEDRGGSWFTAVLGPPRVHRQHGWFLLSYEDDGEEEEIYIGVGPNGRCLVFRTDGEERGPSRAPAGV